MMSFLTYIMAFFMNFELFADFDRLCKLGINKPKNHLKIFLLETTWPISTKLCLNDP
jgi:hypothetical protein